MEEQYNRYITEGGYDNVCKPDDEKETCEVGADLQPRYYCNDDYVKENEGIDGDSNHCVVETPPPCQYDIDCINPTIRPDSETWKGLPCSLWAKVLYDGQSCDMCENAALLHQQFATDRSWHCSDAECPFEKNFCSNCCISGR